MNHWIVERLLRGVYARLSEGDCAPMLQALAPRFEYRFEGDSPIGGVRRSLPAMQQWWARMYRLFPGLHFTVQDIVVRGWPWHTRIFTLLEFAKPLPGGTRYTNVVMQRMVMRWGRVTQIHTLEDTQRCARLLAWKAREGMAEAEAAPISDVAWPQAGPFLGGSERLLPN